MRKLLLAALACLVAGPAMADPPPTTAPPYRPGVSLQPVAIYDAAGNIVSSFGGGGGSGGGGATGSVTGPGVNGTVAQAMQGINGGIPFAVTGSFLLESTFTGRITTLGQKNMAGSTLVVLANDQIVTVTANNWPLPLGASTASNQATANASLGSIDGKMPALVNGRQPVDGSGVTQPVSAVNWPLPTGAATAANQNTANSSLASLDGKTPALVSGRVPVDGSGVTQPVSAASLPLPAGAATAGNQATANTALSSIDTKTPALVGGRQPVDGSGVTQPISAAALPLPSGAATASAQATGNTSLGNLDTKTPALVNGGRPVTVLNQSAAGSMEQDVRGSGTLAATSTSSTLDIPINGQSTVGLRFSGLTASGATLSYLQSNDGGTTFTSVSELNTATGITSLTRTTDGQVRVAVQGRTVLRLQITTAGTGSVSVAWNVSVREGLISIAGPLPPGSNTIGGMNVGTDGTADRKVLTTTGGTIEPPTAGNGKIIRTATALNANTSTIIAAANASRIALGIQCGGGGVSVDEAGNTLTGASVGNGTLFIPTGTGPYFTPPVATRTAITAYTASAQTCVVTEYLR